MKFVHLLMGLLGIQFADAQQPKQTTMQVVVQSAIHAQGGKLVLYEEWPQKKKIDTLVSANGTWTINIQGDAPSVYRLQLYKPYADATIYLEKGKKTVTIAPGKTVQITGGTMQQKLDQFELGLAPMRQRMQAIGATYTAEKNMDRKVLLGEQNQRVYDSLSRRTLAFIRSNAGNINGIWVAGKNMYAWNLGEINTLISMFEKRPIAKPLIASLQVKKQQLTATQMTGSHAPDFVLSAMYGSLIHMDSLAGDHKYVLIDFWASWCAPCRATNRKLAPLYEDLKRKGIEVVSISVDENIEAWKNAVMEDKIPWLQLRTADGMKSAVIEAYKVSSLPATFLINEKGIIEKQNLSHEAIERMIASQP